MKPIFEIIANEQNISDAIADRLISMTITDEAGLVADAVEVTLDDRDFAVALPPTGATLDVSLGYDLTGLWSMGKYSVDEVEASGPPNQVSFRGKSADMSASMKSQRKQSWSKTTLGKVLSEIAGRNNLKEAFGEEYKSVVIDHLDQSYESDLNLLTRLADEHGALTKPSGGYLVFVKRGSSVNAKGEELAVVDIDVVKDSITRWSYSEAEREYYPSVRAFWNDKKNPKAQNHYTAGEGEPMMLMKKPFKDKAKASAAAEAELVRLRLGKYAMSIDCMGNPLLQAESTINLTGVKPECCGEWVVQSVAHVLSGTYTNSLAACRKSDFVREEQARKDEADTNKKDSK